MGEDMANAWETVPCLLALRTEFNRVAPDRDKGSDGTIGDAAHSSTSDHTPDEDSSELRNKDADSENEVHALDIDSSGPWPDGAAWFGKAVLGIIARERARWLDPNDKCRLDYVIWDGWIYDKDQDFAPVKYNGRDQHRGHAHFSARYETECENDTSPWGVAPQITPNKGDDDVTEEQLIAAMTKALKGWTEENPDSTENPKATARVGGWIRMAEQRARGRHEATANAIAATGTMVAAVGAKLGEDTQALVRSLAELRSDVALVDERTVEAIFGSNDEQLVSLLIQALGAQRASAVAAAVIAGTSGKHEAVTNDSPQVTAK